MYFVPEEHEDAELLAERISIRLQHSNSAVVLTTVKVILYLMNYFGSKSAVDSMCRKLSPPLGQSCLVAEVHRSSNRFRSHSHLFWIRSAIRRSAQYPSYHSTATVSAQERRQGLLLQIQRPNLRQACQTRDHLSSRKRAQRRASSSRAERVSRLHHTACRTWR